MMKKYFYGSAVASKFASEPAKDPEPDPVPEPAAQPEPETGSAANDDAFDDDLFSDSEGSGDAAKEPEEKGSKAVREEPAEKAIKIKITNNNVGRGKGTKTLPKKPKAAAAAKSKAKGKGKGKAKGKSSRRSKRAPWELYVYRIFRAEFPHKNDKDNVYMTKKVMSIMNNVVEDIITTVMDQAKEMRESQRRTILMQKDIKAAVGMTMPREIAKYAIDRANLALAQYGHDMK